LGDISLIFFQFIYHKILEKAEMERNKSLLNGVLGKGSAPNVKVIQGVRIEDITIGTGNKAVSGKKCKMHYVGRLKSTNNVFDSSKNKPFAFKLGRSEVIRGWDIGVEGMLVGGKRILTIPPEKGYGKGGAPPTIPGNATLIFEVTLLEVN
jgi:FK506-binding nuclear protein